MAERGAKHSSKEIMEAGEKTTFFVEENNNKSNGSEQAEQCSKRSNFTGATYMINWFSTPIQRMSKIRRRAEPHFYGESNHLQTANF